jgi:hypothetical protein
MKYIDYTLKSLQVFILCFILGTFIDREFHKYQESLSNPNYIIIGVIQLLTIISVTYILQSVQFLQQFFEEYTPNVLFSSFLLSLQYNMIDNFKRSLTYEYFFEEKTEMDFMRALQRFLTPDTQYPEYIIFLMKQDNKYKSLTSYETFTILKELKKVGELSFENLMKFMY